MYYTRGALIQKKSLNITFYKACKSKTQCREYLKFLQLSCTQFHKAFTFKTLYYSFFQCSFLKISLYWYEQLGVNYTQLTEFWTRYLVHYLRFTVLETHRLNTDEQAVCGGIFDSVNFSCHVTKLVIVKKKNWHSQKYIHISHLFIV